MPTKEELQQRLDQISELFASIVTHADHQSLALPYKNRFDRCTPSLAAATNESPVSKGNSRSASVTTNWTIARRGSDPAESQDGKGQAKGSRQTRLAGPTNGLVKVLLLSAR
jgi:hypothetical protein